MNYVRIGKRTLNLDSVSYAEVQVWQDEMTVKVYFSGLANNTPLVFGENDAKELWKYLEYVAEKAHWHDPSVSSFPFLFYRLS